MMAQNETAAAERKAQAEEISQLRNTMLDLRASMVELRLVVGEYTATTFYYFLILPITPSVSCSCLDALNTPSSKLPMSPSVSLRLPLSTTCLSILPNPNPQAIDQQHYYWNGLRQRWW